MAVISELRMTVSKTVNLGNYESVKLEATAFVSRNDDSDTSAKMQDELLEQIRDLLDVAYKEHVPARRRQG